MPSTRPEFRPRASRQAGLALLWPAPPRARTAVLGTHDASHEHPSTHPLVRHHDLATASDRHHHHHTHSLTRHHGDLVPPDACRALEQLELAFDETFMRHILAANGKHISKHIPLNKMWKRFLRVVQK